MSLRTTNVKRWYLTEGFRDLMVEATPGTHVVTIESYGPNGSDTVVVTADESLELLIQALQEASAHAKGDAT